MAIEATLIIEPEGATSASQTVLLEADDVLNVDTSGEEKTSFSPGDKFYFRTQVSTDIEITDIVATDGTFQGLGSKSRSRVEDVTFASRDPESPPNHTLAAIPSSGLSYQYVGRQGSITHTVNSNGSVVLNADMNLVPFLTKITYNYNCNLYVLHTPNVILGPDETYEIVIVAYTRSLIDEVNNACSNS